MSILKEVPKNTGVIQNNCKFILQNIKKRLFLDKIPIVLTFKASYYKLSIKSYFINSRFKSFFQNGFYF